MPARTLHPVSLTAPTASHAIRQLLPMKDAARVLGISVWTLRSWVYSGRCASHKLGSKVCVSELELSRILMETERPRATA
jgi:excisionase family DNA binding protein